MALACLASCWVLGASAVQAGPTAAQQAQIDQLKKTYPTDTCIVSGDNLQHNDMHSPIIDYLYTQKNPDGTQTTRLIRLCCNDCLRDFKRNPSKYLKILDADQAKQDAATAPAPAK